MNGISDMHYTGSNTSAMYSPRIPEVLGPLLYT